MRCIRRSARLSRLLLLALLATTACSRPISVPTEDVSNEGSAPFGNSQEPGNGSGPAPASAGQTTPERSLPFRKLEEVPAGTLLSVRLELPITVAVPIADDSFQGVVEQSVVIDGGTFIPQGTRVAGRIETVFISKLEPERSYVRLALESVHLGTADVPVQTTSFFARQSRSPGQTSSTVLLEKGRRLTFRLTEPLPIKPQSTQARR
jgi:hypothetical protein